MPTMRLHSRAQRRVAVALAAALSVAAPAARAEAQSDCATGSLAQYTSEGFTCRIGGWTLSDLIANSGSKTQGGAEALAPDLASVLLTPFVGTDATGRPTFGFDVAGFTTAAGSHGTTSEIERSHGIAGFGFILTGLPGGSILGVQTSGSFDGFNNTPGSFRAGSTYGGSAMGMNAGNIVSCIFPSANSNTPGGAPPTVGGDCKTPLTGTVFVDVSIGSTASRFDGSSAPVDGFSSATLTRLAVTQAPTATVPEPATVALLGGGLLALAAPAVARRRAVAGGR